MRPTIPILLALLSVAGCLGDAPDAPAGATPSPEPANSPSFAPVEVVNETIDFAENADGLRTDGGYEERPVEVPAGATTLTFTVDWTSATPTSSTRGVRVSLFDASGARVGDCHLDTNVVTEAESRRCGPSTNNVREGPYKLTWEGFGNVVAHVVVLAE